MLSFLLGILPNGAAGVALGAAGAGAGVDAPKENPGFDVDAGSEVDGAPPPKLKAGTEGLSPFSAGFDVAKENGFVSVVLDASSTTGLLRFAAF